VDHVSLARPRLEAGRLDLLLTRTQRAEPCTDSAVQHRAFVVPEVPQEPPEPCGATGHALVVGDDEDVRADSRAGGGAGEVVGGGQRMPAASLAPRELGVLVEERRPGDMPSYVELPSPCRLAELVPAIDELVPHTRSLLLTRDRRASRSRRVLRSCGGAREPGTA